MAEYSPEFIKWFGKLNHAECSLKQVAWRSWVAAQRQLSDHLLPDLVNASGEMTEMREAVLKVTEGLTVQLATITERMGYYGKG